MMCWKLGEILWDDTSQLVCSWLTLTWSSSNGFCIAGKWLIDWLIDWLYVRCTTSSSKISCSKGDGTLARFRRPLHAYGLWAGRGLLYVVMPAMTQNLALFDLIWRTVRIDRLLRQTRSTAHLSLLENVHMLFQNKKKNERYRQGYRAKCILPDLPKLLMANGLGQHSCVCVWVWQKAYCPLTKSIDVYWKSRWNSNIHGNLLFKIPHLTFRVLNNKRRTRMHPLFTPSLSHHAKNGTLVLWTRTQ